MWQLVTRGGEALLKDIRPECKPAYRRPLLAQGLIEESRVGRATKLSLTDAGWHYLATHMTDSVKTMSAATSASVLQGLLAAMHAHMQKNDVTIAEIFSPIAESAERGVSGNTLWDRLSRSWSTLQEADDGIRLEKLRHFLADVARESVDSALLEWQKQGKIVIYPYDDGERITPAVREAALRIHGREGHIIYLK